MFIKLPFNDNNKMYAIKHIPLNEIPIRFKFFRLPQSPLLFKPLYTLHTGFQILLCFITNHLIIARKPKLVKKYAKSEGMLLYYSNLIEKPLEQVKIRG